jgi:streptogramin lyase
MPVEQPDPATRGAIMSLSVVGSLALLDPLAVGVCLGGDWRRARADTAFGSFTEYALSTVGAGPGSITSGPDGNLWFTEAGANSIGRINTAGQKTDFVVPTYNSSLTSIATGPDGNLWFTERLANKIGLLRLAGL